MIVDSIRLAIGPMILKRMDSPGNKRYYSKILLYTSYVLMFAIVGVSMFSFEIIKVIAKSKEFWDAAVIIPGLALSIFFINMKEVTVYGLHIAKKTRTISLIVVFSTVLSIALNFLLIPLWDIKGAALATLLAQFFYWFACYYYSQKVFYIPYEISKISIILLTGAVLSFSSLFFNSMDIVPRMIIKMGCLVSFPFILYLLNFMSQLNYKLSEGFL